MEQPQLPVRRKYQELPKRGVDLQSEAMVMARKKLKGSDADDMTYRTKMALPAALIELTPEL